MNPDTLKQAICDALAAFIRSRPGFDPCNYGDAASYRADQRTAARQKNDAETMLAAVRWRDSITGADLIEAARGGRLTIVPARVEYPNQNPDHGYSVRIDYCTGQYYPTEYRAGVCRVLASALWNYARDNMPPGTLHHNSETGETLERYDGLRAGDYLRRKFRAEFGSALQRRWFD